ncbi:anti-sigma factor family protein [Sphingomonas hankookensis]|uniref:anti-sigma factor family protein n=1 Tax=Sphingomonas hankookensis TaxID=563996 RepID=UPI001F5AD1C2|nr:anti-sigma factor [Sphingomonas hankookensis]
MTIDPETLAAYADGELDPLSARRVERAIADDPAFAAEVERHHALTARLRGSFATLDTQPMPAGVEALFARPDNVVAFPVRKPAPKPQRWWGAIAASLVAGLLLGQLVPRSGSDLGFEGGTAVAQGNLARALDTQFASTQGAQAPVKIGITFRDRAGALCRTFETGTTGGIACAGNKGLWRVQALQGGAETTTTAYAQAGSPIAAVLAQAQAMAAGDPLDAAGEAAALKGR